MTSMAPQTVFTRDVMGRYVCNTFTEATQSDHSIWSSLAAPSDLLWHKT